MTPGPRGWIVLLCMAAWAVGACMGQSHERAKWDRWTYAHIAFETKGDRK